MTGTVRSDVCGRPWPGWSWEIAQRQITPRSLARPVTLEIRSLCLSRQPDRRLGRAPAKKERPDADPAARHSPRARLYWKLAMGWFGPYWIGGNTIRTPGLPSVTVAYRRHAVDYPRYGIFAPGIIACRSGGRIGRLPTAPIPSASTCPILLAAICPI